MHDFADADIKSAILAWLGEKYPDILEYNDGTVINHCLRDTDGMICCFYFSDNGMLICHPILNNVFLMYSDMLFFDDLNAYCDKCIAFGCSNGSIIK